MNSSKKYLSALLGFATMAEMGKMEMESNKYLYHESIKKGSKKSILTPSQQKTKSKNRKKRKNKKQ